MTPSKQATVATPRPTPLALAGLALLAGLTGCGSATSKTAAVNSGTPSAAVRTPVSPSVPASASSTPSGGENCGSAQAEVRAGVGVTGSVTSVEIVGQCTTASVGTSLGKTADDADAAVGICRIAAAQAYSHGVTAVNVTASDGTGLAIGISGGECIAVPKS